MVDRKVICCRDETKGIPVSGQRYHRDADHTQWVKFFVYVSDVPDTRSGPFKYARGSHRRDAMPLMQGPHTRFPDEKVLTSNPSIKKLELELLSRP